jgi:catechol 2,3-dioxygenase-like lactoylglutathione lyase family enzyme
MFARVTIRVSDVQASRRFYETVLAALGVGGGPSGSDWGDFAIAPADDDDLVTRRLHIGFIARSREQVDAFWRTGIDAGYRGDGDPGPRPQYRHDYYGAFLLDPDGNSAEAVHHGALHEGDVIDHLWLRCGDVRATTGFYETIAPYVGLTVADTSDDHAWFKGASGSFTLVPGDPTQHLHLSFAAGDVETVDAFHRAALSAGCRDAGSPGDRSRSGRDGYAAAVLDPNANTIEVVYSDARGDRR